MKAFRSRALAAALVAVLATVSATALSRDQVARATSASGCQLSSAKGDIKHVIYIQFDNVHLRRDRADVPSHPEQMPHPPNLMRDNGTPLTNDHTLLIPPTAGG